MPTYKGASNSVSPSRRPPRTAASKSKDGKRWIVKIVGMLLLPILFGYFSCHLHQRFIVLPGRISTKCNLAPVLSEDVYTAKKNSELYWGTYRSNLYFGMRTRSPKSPVIGLMWYEQPEHNIIIPNLRHWCDQSDGVSKYGWLEHDGRSYGIQHIYDNNISLNTSFVKQPGGSHGGDWTARISALSHTLEDTNKLSHSFIVYVTLPYPDSDGSYLRPHLTAKDTMQRISRIAGFTPELGSFVISFGEASNVVGESFLAARVEPNADLRKMKELIISGTGVIEHNLSLLGYLPSDVAANDRPNVLAIQITFQKSTSFDIIFQSDSVSQRQVSLTGDEYDRVLAQRRHSFENKFEQSFHLSAKGYPDIYKTMGKYALSNMIGSIGFFHGYSRVQSQYTVQQQRLYGPHNLFTTVPSRSFFPRGFLWDEGFHHLLLRRFDEQLSLEILGSWLDLMNIEGWIPREMILGLEAEHSVPPEFVVQQNSIANPPMLLYLLKCYLQEKDFAAKHRNYLSKVFPRVKLWYKWLNGSQIGPEPGTYRWRGRNETTDLELNPKTLASGLDDYPRSSHPNEEEYHLDLLCWMAFSSQVMADLASLLNDSDQAIFEQTAKLLSSPKHIDEKHWSEKAGRYCDYGLHTRHVKLTNWEKEGGGKVERREVLREPQRRLVSDTFGYVSLYPLLLRLIPTDSAKLGRLLNQLTDTDLLASPFGLRSLALTSPLYAQHNTPHDPPYWRGSIWININYLVLSALHHYAQQSGPYQQLSFKVYSDIRSALLSNVAREFKRTGYLWEHYNDQTGRGEGSHPFTGWTSLVLLIMAEQYN